METKEDKQAEMVCGVVALIVAVPAEAAYTLLGAWLACDIWDRFMVPLEYQPLPYSLACGALLLYALYRIARFNPSGKKASEMLSLIAFGWIAYLMLYAAALIVHAFVY